MQPDRAESSASQLSLRFPVTPYQPDRGGSPLGVLLLLVVSIAAGAALGYGVSWLNRWLYIGVLYPALMGVLVGLAGAVVNCAAKVRRPGAVIAAGLLGGGASFVSMEYFDFRRVGEQLAGSMPGALVLRFQDLAADEYFKQTEQKLQEVRQQLKEVEALKGKAKPAERLKLEELSLALRKNELDRRERKLDPRFRELIEDPALGAPRDLQPALRQFLRESEPELRGRIEAAIRTQVRGMEDGPGPDIEKELEQAYRPWLEQFTFADSLRARAEQGVVIQKLPRLNNDPVNLGYVGSYLFWAAEALLAGGIAAFLMWFGADQPFCARCNRWKDERLLGKLTLDAYRVMRIFEGGDLGWLEKRDVAVAEGRVHVKAAVCPNCGADAPIDIRIEELALKKGDDSKERDHLTYPGEALPVLEAFFAPAPETDEELPAPAGD